MSLRNTLVDIMNRNIILYSLFAIVSLIVLEEVLVLEYIPKQVIRLSLFLLIPLFGIYYIRKSTLLQEIKFEKPTLQELKIPLLVSIVIFFGTLGGYYMLRFMYDASYVIEGAQELGISPSNVLIWGFYLCFVNSLVEEFFFRGYLFYTLEKRSYKLAIILSSFLWAVYHVIIFVTIFPIYTVIFSITGLTIIGILLAYINKFGKSFINSWIVHIFADIAIVIIVLYMYTLI